MTDLDPGARSRSSSSSLILGALVLVHELGHFVTARLAGVRVLEFGIGFPPRAKVLRREGRDALHAELAADRRLRQARGRGRRRGGRSALVRPRRAADHGSSSSSPGVVMNLVTRARRSSPLIAWLATPLVGIEVRRGPGRTRRPRRPASQPGDDDPQRSTAGPTSSSAPADPSTTCARTSARRSTLTIERADGDARDVTGHPPDAVGDRRVGGRRSASPRRARRGSPVRADLLRHVHRPRPAAPRSGSASARPVAGSG